MNALTLACTAFVADKQLISGPLVEVALAVKNQQDSSPIQNILVFNDNNGKVVDLDLRGDKAEIIAKLSTMVIDNSAHKNTMVHHDPLSNGSSHDENDAPKRGRPKLGVVGKEVTLLPRHWQWLSEQPGGASVALRKLVEAARKSEQLGGQHRQAQEKAYRFMSTMAGNLPDFEEASRALFAMDVESLKKHSQDWPSDIVAYLLRLLKSE